MGRIEPYSLGFLSGELENFRDSVTSLINYGKYATPIITSLPTWAAQDGEEVLFRPTSGGTTSYRYLNSAWVSTWSITI